MYENKLAAAANFPKITVKALSGPDITLGTPAGGHDWQMAVIYRGKHCPMCSNYLKVLDKLRDQYNATNIDVVVASADPEEKARAHIAALGVDLTVGYDLSIAQMQQLGLYISNPRSPQENDRPFAEPGVFVINESGQAQIIDISNTASARPDLEILLSGIKWIRNPDNNYPIRGTYK